MVLMTDPNSNIDHPTGHDDVTTSSLAVGVNDDDDDDWEEWDGRSPFWAHCFAGSIAGVVEHAAIFPLDTVRTHIQVCAACLQRNIPTSTSITPSSAASSSNGIFTTTPSSSSLGLRGSSTTTTTTTTASSSSSSASTAQQRLPLGMIQTIRYLVNEPVVATVTDTAAHTTIPKTTQSLQIPNTSSSIVEVAGWSRLFRGIQAVLVGCVPAHALYFSSYEIVKASFLGDDGRASTIGSSLAGAAAVTSHDLIMTPLDTVKQRLQIGHYSNAQQAARSIYKNEGFVALYRSFPITLLTNIPYGMVMVTTHEACKQMLRDRLLHDHHHHQYHYQQWQFVLMASSIAGLLASAVTTPLDRIKTALQTQQLTPICGRKLLNCPKLKNTNAAATALSSSSIIQPPKHLNWQQAARTIYIEEGMIGFWRGILPRILSHTPAAAISWTTYETVKQYILSSSSSH